MTNEDRIRAIEKIAASEEQKAFLEGQAKAHGDYAKSRNESADSLSNWGTAVGVGGGTAGGAMALKGVKQMRSEGVLYDRRDWPKSYREGPPITFETSTPPRQPTDLFPKYKEMTGPIRTIGGKVHPAFTMKRTGTQTIGGELYPVYGGPIVPRSKVPPKLQGKRLALKGGLFGLGSLVLSALLHRLASSNRNKANEHTKRLEQIKDQMR